MAQLPTLRVVYWKDQSQSVLINAQDFDPAIHTRWEDYDGKDEETSKEGPQKADEEQILIPPLSKEEIPTLPSGEIPVIRQGTFTTTPRAVRRGNKESP